MVLEYDDDFKGMTLNQMSFNIWDGTFTAGQLYAALSRVKSLEGLNLFSPIRKGHIIVSIDVQKYFEQFLGKAIKSL